MARQRRLSAAGYVQHVVQRGNNRQAIFLDDRDRAAFISMLREAVELYPVDLWGYVCMPNHVHLLATPNEQDALSRMMQQIGRRYVRYFNDRHQRTGTLWEGRYRSTVIDSEAYFLACLAYIDSNPVRAQLASRAEDFPWSSARHHLGLEVLPFLKDAPLYWQLGNTPFERQLAYRAILEEGVARSKVDEIRQATQKGWALGDGSFIDGLEQSASRRAAPLRRGRPRKSPAE